MQYHRSKCPVIVSISALLLAVRQDTADESLSVIVFHVLVIFVVFGYFGSIRCLL